MNRFIKLLNLSVLSLALGIMAGSAFAQVEVDEAEHEEGHIELTPQQITRSGIALSTATSGTVREVVSVYGVVTPNAERVQSVRARYEGLITAVHKSIGDPVRRGESLATVEANSSLNTYQISASIDGMVTERMANVGEQTSDAPLFVVQDFSRLWVDLSVFPKDLDALRMGQQVRIRSLTGDQSTESTIFYLAPYGQGESQTVTARAEIDNSSGVWKPGQFINADISIAEGSAAVVISNEAVQTTEEGTVVFVQDEEGVFEPRPVTLGRTDGVQTAVLEGLAPGDVYVSQNSFVLKSELGKEDAEHGH